MIRKAVLVCVIGALALHSPALRAQSGRFYGGLKGGLNMAQIDGDGIYGYNRFGPGLGVFGAAKLGALTELQIEFLYGVRGSRYNARSSRMVAYRLQYVDVPLIFSVKDWFHEGSGGNYYKMHFQGGLYGGRLISSTSVDTARLDVNFRRNDFGWLLGFTYYPSVHWGWYGRFTSSFLPLLRYSNSLGEEIRMKSYFISLGLTYRFN